MSALLFLAQRATAVVLAQLFVSAPFLVRSLQAGFESVDPASYTFRYPTGRDGESALPKHFAFNVLSFAHRLDPLLESLSGAVTALRSIGSSQRSSRMKIANTKMTGLEA